MENGRGVKEEEEEEEEEAYDRAKEVKQFDDSKIGVKGLFNSGITSIPCFFIHPPDSLPRTAIAAPPPPPAGSNPIPTVNLSGFDSDRRSIIIVQIQDAACRLGFFQVTNHGIPSEVMDRTIAGIKAFYEQPTEIKALYYNRERQRSVSYYSNFDLYRSKAATWSDTISIRWGPNFHVSDIPVIFRSELVEWDRQVKRLGETLMEFLSEGLGVGRGRLKELRCTEGQTMAALYYPFCPQPDLTLGITSDRDPSGVRLLYSSEMYCRFGGTGWMANTWWSPDPRVGSRKDVGI